ncbi:hypothetical protein [Streptomyces flavochromogenes]|uniref:hypothetical protein n=1 Tax=Streptomyces flavochromogenes TaxID=68199 RepID=UPI0004C1550F|nr:hypothetical protein [Streptomyces flavochromogenes]
MESSHRAKSGAQSHLVTTREGRPRTYEELAHPHTLGVTGITTLRRRLIRFSGEYGVVTRIGIADTWATAATASAQPAGDDSAPGYHRQGHLIALPGLHQRGDVITGRPSST